MSSNRDRVPFELSQAEADEQFERLFGPFDALDGIVTTESAMKHIGVREECARIRAELIDWLVGDLDSIGREHRAINGRLIVDEIDRICPKD